MIGERVVVALGGNALQSANKPPTAKAQLETTRATAKILVRIIEKGYQLIIGHGNGPQVGRIILASEQAASVTPVMPFPECNAMSQGYIGYHLQQALGEELNKGKLNKQVASIITQVLVNPNDKAFDKPTKPIGAFYTEMEANILQKDRGYTMKEDAGRGWRRVVPSPKPIDIIEKDIIKTMVDNNILTITVGGGGIPVIHNKMKLLKGIPAVIDKDFASEKLAEILDADILLILTEVENAAIHFNTPKQKNLGVITINQINKYIKEGHFAPGSMLPKIEAAKMFAKSKKGRRSIITSLSKAIEGLEGKTGTIIVNK